jgi:hypothetical protein
MTLPEKPEFAVNTSDATVADALNGFIRYAKDGLVGETHLDVATAYFNVGGYQLLADSLDGLDGVRILIGAEPDDRDRRVRHLRSQPSSAMRAGRVRLQRALQGLERDLAQGRDLLGFTLEADESAKRLVAWLRSGKVQVRRLDDRFLHGKAFIVGDHDHGVVAGSSNFTYAGLARNVELNLGNYSPTVVGQVSGWFEDLWTTASDYDLAALFEERFEPHAPQLIYLRMLFERYGAELAAEAEASGQPKIHLTSFQRDGLWRARRILGNLGGVLIADEVGLGKTFLAGELIREASIERRQRVLVVAPATLRDGPWRAFLSDQLLPVEVVSFDDLAADTRLNPENGTGRKLQADSINDYAMVVIDEAHNLRNPSTQRADALRRLLAGSPPKQLLLLTATPVNNSLWDLYYLLGYFVRNDATFADVGIKSLRDHFARAMALNPEDLTPEHLFDVLDAVAVRRTRSFVKRFYPNDRVRIGGIEVPILFPTPRVHKVSYDLDAVLPGFFEKFAHALEPTAAAPEDDPGVLTFARYAPSRYRLDGDSDAYELQLAGLLGSGLLKRFESSPYAFARTCEKMADNHDAFLALLTHGKVATGGALADWIATDSDDSDEVDLYMDAYVDVLVDAAEYDVASLTAHVEHDRDLLREFAATARTVDRQSDPTLAALVEELAAIVEQAAAEGVGPDDIRDKRKVLIFSYFSDTVEWVVEHLRNVVADDSRLAPYRDRITSISGSGGGGSKDKVLWGFAPRTTDAPSGFDDDLFDIVVTTDVLAEGVNLQQARHIINYDLPWNPMRLVQRHGRIDRIGSRHSEVFLRCVFPDDKLDELLGLEARLQHKIKQAAATVGVGHVLPDQTAVDRDFSETREEIDRLRNEDNEIFERGGTTKGVLSGEEFRQELRAALEDEVLAEQISGLPWGSGSGMAVERAGQTRTAYVFCARIGDWERPVFRYVETGGGADPTIVDDTLACLDHARPDRGFDTPRVLDDDTYRGAFEAWDAARADIVEGWNWYSDKANLEPQVPKVLAQAADVVRAHPPKGLHLSEVELVIDTLQAPYPERILRTFRTALASTSDAAEQAELIVRVIGDLGLQPYEAPEPLPDITDDDVNLVCWIAITPGGPDPGWLADGQLPITVASGSGQSSLADPAPHEGT